MTYTKEFLNSKETGINNPTVKNVLIVFQELNDALELYD